MKKIIISQEVNPYFNIAAEHQLFLNSDEDIHLFLWQNESSVIIGRNQNVYAECDLAYLMEQDMKVVRRFSGGGAVYHDEGNVNFTFITKESSANHIQFIDFLRSSMLKLGIDCEFSGRNDLLYKNQKFSGHAYYTDNDNYMYHGTILVHVDFNQLGKALTPSRLKLQSKGIDSVKSRVVNLSEINKEITTGKVMEAFIQTFDCNDIEYINKTNFDAPLESLLLSYDWLYGQAPDFDIVLERKYSFGNVSVHILISDGIIKDAKISTDSLRFYDFEICENNIKGKKFDEASILDYLDLYIFSHLNLS